MIQTNQQQYCLYCYYYAINDTSIAHSGQKSSKVLETSCLSSLRQKLSSDKTIPQLLSLLIQSLISQILMLQAKEYSSTKTVISSQYGALEESVQKSEQQIRKHIRIEQQMKLYTDSIEQKLQSTQKKLQKQENLTDGLKFENRQLKNKLRDLQKSKHKQKQQKSRLAIPLQPQENNSNRQKSSSKIIIMPEQFSSKLAELKNIHVGRYQDRLKKRKSTKGSLRKKLYKDMDVYRTLDHNNQTQHNSYNHSRSKRKDHSVAVLRRQARCNSVCK